MNKYKAIITTAGAVKIAAASAGGTQLKIVSMAVGDGTARCRRPIRRKQNSSTRNTAPRSTG